MLARHVEIACWDRILGVVGIAFWERMLGSHVDIA